MRGKHRLIRRDDGSPTRKRRLDRVERRSIGAADQFDENVDVRGGGKLGWIGEIESAAEIDPPVALAPRAIGRHSEVAPHPHSQSRAAPVKKANQARPDNPETGDAQAKRVRHLLLAPPLGEPDFERLIPKSQ